MSFASRREFLQNLVVGAALAAAGDAGASDNTLKAPTKDLVRLNENVNPYGPSAKVIAAIQAAITGSSHYPGAQQQDLVQQIAASHSVKPEQIILGCGSTEVLRVAAMAFLGPGKKLIQASPTYEAMENYARSCGADVVSVPLNKKQGHDLGAMLSHVDANTGLIYICNPNNPTASITPEDDLKTFLGKLPHGCHVLIDEAYYHYANHAAIYSSFLNSPWTNEDLIVTRTFSAVYGLAGLRIGYGVASPTSVRQMESYANQSGVNSIALQAASAALQDTAALAQAVSQNRDDRQEFLNRATLHQLKPIDSQANFVMMDTYRPARMIIDHFQSHGVLIGPAYPTMNTFVRISLGSAQDMQAFWHAWEGLPFFRMPSHH